MDFREATEFLLSLIERVCVMAYLVDDFEVRISVSADLELGEVMNYLVENRELLEIDSLLYMSDDYIQIPRRGLREFIGVTLEDNLPFDEKILVLESEVMCGEDGEGEYVTPSSDYRDLTDKLVEAFELNSLTRLAGMRVPPCSLLHYRVGYCGECE